MPNFRIQSLTSHSSLSRTFLLSLVWFETQLNSPHLRHAKKTQRFVNDTSPPTTLTPLHPQAGFLQRSGHTPTAAMLKIWSMKQQQQKDEVAAGPNKKKKVTAAQLRVQKGTPL